MQVMEAKKKFQLARVLTMLVPFICSLLFVIDLVLNFYGYDYRIINYLGGTSIIIWIYLLYNSYVFNLCTHHRIFIYYLIITNSLAIIDYYIGIPIDTINYYIMLFVGFGVAVLLYGYLKFKENKTNHEKINS